ncbi:oligosaccharide flippase family protein [Paenibacillus solisilvae]|uniref:Oligosaccharide flippase family protein n=1 Tax=Paenibacillus solisilvae TaxID=2486751 RepID=A0ABW0VTI4_9BACL
MKITASSTGKEGLASIEQEKNDFVQKKKAEMKSRGDRVVWKGAALMGLAMLISKVIGTLQKIPLQNVAGDRVFGIYNAVYPLYQLLLVMVTAGFPVAVSLLVAEHEAVDDRLGARRVLKASMLLLFLSGIAGFMLMWLGADQIAGWIGDPSTVQAVKAASLALWFTPVMAALRGYYQGRGQMLPSAVSQLSEQLVRVTAMITMLWIGWQFSWSDAALAAGATSGSAFGGAAGLAVMAVYGLRERRAGRSGIAAGLGGRWNEASTAVVPDEAKDAAGEMNVESGDQAKQRLNGRFEDHAEDQSGFSGGKKEGFKAFKSVNKGNRDSAAAISAEGSGGLGIWQQIRRLALLAIPVTLGALAVPALSVVDAFTVPRLLKGTGMEAAEAMSLFGQYGRGQPLVQLVVMVAGAMGAALVPALASARARKDHGAVKQQAALVMRAAWAVGAAAALGLALLAEPINVMLYADDTGSRTFALVGLTAFAGTVNAVAAAALQGLGAVRAPALFMLAAALLKAAFNAALVPAFGTAGAACAGIAALTAAALLSAGAVRRAAGAAMPASGAAGIGLALACTAAALVLAERGAAALLGPLPPRAAAAALALGGVALGGAVFAAAMLRCGGITARELRALPGGEALAARLQNWRLLPQSRRSGRK